MVSSGNSTMMVGEGGPTMACISNGDQVLETLSFEKVGLKFLGSSRLHFLFFEGGGRCKPCFELYNTHESFPFLNFNVRSAEHRSVYNQGRHFNNSLSKGKKDIRSLFILQ